MNNAPAANPSAFELAAFLEAEAAEYVEAPQQLRQAASKLRHLQVEKDAGNKKLLSALGKISALELAAETGNRSLFEYMEHWETRTKKAEAALAQTTAKLESHVPFNEWAQSYLDAGQHAGGQYCYAIKAVLLQRDEELSKVKAQIVTAEVAAHSACCAASEHIEIAKRAESELAEVRAFAACCADFNDPIDRSPLEVIQRCFRREADKAQELRRELSEARASAAGWRKLAQEIEKLKANP